MRIIKDNGTETEKPTTEEPTKKASVQDRLTALEDWRASLSKHTTVETEVPKREGLPLRRKIMIGLLIIIAVVIAINFYQIVILGYELPF